MPIVHKDRNINNDLIQLKEKRNRRDRTKTKYQLIRKGKPKDSYDYIEVYVNGKKVELTDASKYMLEMLIKDSD
jgi:molecular chaperone DnaK (HSP70)